MIKLLKDLREATDYNISIKDLLKRLIDGKLLGIPIDQLCIMIVFSYKLKRA